MSAAIRYDFFTAPRQKKPSLIITRNCNYHQKAPTKIPCLESGDSISSSSASDSNVSIIARRHFYYQQLRFQLSRDIWWLSLAVVVICVVESNHYNSQPLAFSTFNIIFEVVSAYSYVGVSVGYPGKNYSFCGEWTPFSKVLLILISFVGRHRDWPISNGDLRWPRPSEEAADRDSKVQERNTEHFSTVTVRLY